MKLSLLCFTLLIVISLSDISHAQFRNQQPSPYNNTGKVIKTEYQQPENGMFNLFNMRMSHSYEATFSSFGNSVYNQNFYTNSMMFTFSPNMTGRLDVSFAHSPFGDSYMSMANQNRIFIRNAELRYKISENSTFSLHFSEQPISPLGYWHPYNSPATGQY